MGLDENTASYSPHHYLLYHCPHQVDARSPRHALPHGRVLLHEPTPAFRIPSGCYLFSCYLLTPLFKLRCTHAWVSTGSEEFGHPIPRHPSPVESRSHPPLSGCTAQSSSFNASHTHRGPIRNPFAAFDTLAVFGGDVPAATASTATTAATDWHPSPPPCPAAASHLAVNLYPSTPGAGVPRGVGAWTQASLPPSPPPSSMHSLPQVLDTSPPPAVVPFVCCCCCCCCQFCSSSCSCSCSCCSCFSLDASTSCGHTFL